MRQVILFNNDWKFHRGDVSGVNAAAFDDSHWRSLTLPHDWSIEGPFDPQWASATGYLPGGIGWYRKTFELPEGFASWKVYHHFDGIYCNSEVWINGHYLGKRPNGFISFRYDLTPYLNSSGRNIIAVKVDHSQFGDARWYTGSGINRNVYLIAMDPVHIKQWGVFVTTLVVTKEHAEVRVEVTLQNHTDALADALVEHTLLDSQGVFVAAEVTSAAIPARQEGKTSTLLYIRKPDLWSINDPNLYRLQTVIHRNGRKMDEEETMIGIRSFQFDPNQGFFLNGESLKLKGVCLHDDAGALGTAVPVKVWERRLQLLKAAGVNAIRMAHNPHAPELYDLCDRMGFLVQDEAFDEWEEGKNKWLAGWNVGQSGKDGYHEYFLEWAETDLRDMILRDRNHPCIIMWSIGNEIDYPNDPYTHEILNVGTNPQIFGRGYQPDRPHSDRLGEVAGRLVEVAKMYDSTRPITGALSAALISNETGFAEALDIVGYNYQEYRYPEDHARYPDRVLYGSENGMHWSQWQAVANNPFISAQFLWTGIDYLGEASQWPARSNGAGLLDLAGFPKPEYYFRQSIWTAEPMIYMGTCPAPEGEETVTLWSHKKAEPSWSGEEGARMRVSCFTNCESVELSINNRSLGIKNLSDAEGHVIWWDVTYEPGTLTANGIHHGEVVTSTQLKTSGPPKKILAEANTHVLAADGVDLTHVAVTVVDENGIPVYTANDEITWTIEGPARLLGLESGDPTSHEDYKANTRRVFHGRLLGYIQAAEIGGTVNIRLSAPLLEEAIVVIRAEK